MTRYAIYFVPDPDTPLWNFGSKVVGYDSANGIDVPFHDDPFFVLNDIMAWTEDPRRYGFHATLKAPFELAAGRTIADLEHALTTFCRKRGRYHWAICGWRP